MVQIVDAAEGSPEAAVQGVLAVYRPESGPAEVGGDRGGMFELDLRGLEGKAARLVVADVDTWRLENLNLPAGVRLAPFRATAATGAPLTAVARLGPRGLEGSLRTGNFQNPGDALIRGPGDRPLVVRLQDGTFRAGPGEALPPGQYLAGTLLTDAQQRRQEVYRDLLRPATTGPMVTSTTLLAWADPHDLGFNLADHARLGGAALLRVPLRLERPTAGTRVTVPGALVGYRRIQGNLAVRPLPGAAQAANQHLRFQLPPEVLPLAIDRAVLTARIDAPGRRVTLGGHPAGEGGAEARPVELRSVHNPLDPIRVEITDAKLLRLDPAGGLHVQVGVSARLDGEAGAGTVGGEKWTVRYIELEVSGTVKEEG
jgi:hypothetical protein